MPVLMLMLITLLNDGTLITIGYDNAVASHTPPKWNMMYLFSMAAVQAGVAMVSSLLLLWILLDSWNKGSLMQMMGIGGISYGKVTTAIYLKVSISDFLTLFSSRAGGEWFWAVRPANILIFGACFALSCSTIIAMFWPKSRPDDILTIGLLDSPPYLLVLYVWIWSIAWAFAVDAAKVGFAYLATKYNLFDINNTGMIVLGPEAQRIKQQLENEALQPTLTVHSSS
jgi:H+-transporting ATPase